MTTGTHHAASSGGWLIGQCDTTRLGALFHQLVKIRTDLLSLLGRLRCAHFGAMFGSFLWRHELTAVDLSLLLRFSLFFGRFLVSRQCDASRQRQGSSQGGHYPYWFHHRRLL
jgi:hypothetical protein